MSIKTGDRVKIITKNSIHEGRTGTVLHVYEDENSCDVEIKSDVAWTGFASVGVVTGFFTSELEHVRSDDDEGQIDKIGGALAKEEIAGWTEEDARAVAASLFKSGVRFRD